MNPGSHDNPVRPKGMPRRKGMKATRPTVRGDLTHAKAEAALWLNPTRRYA